MGLNRRQFITLGGGLLGSFGLTVAAQKLQPSGNMADSAPLSRASLSPQSGPPAPPDSLAQTATIPPPNSLRIAVISDLNSQYGSTSYDPEVDQAIALLSDWQPNLVLCGGDMVAGQSTALSRAQIQAMWAAFDRHVGAPLRQAGMPYGFTLGNHDGSGARSSSGSFTFAADREIAAAHWNDPRHSPGLQFVDRASFPFYYTFQQEGVFFLVWDASTAQLTADQLAWVERSLASPTAQAAQLRIVMGHLPLYGIAVGRDRAGEFLNNAEALRSLLERYGVHTYISGHGHAYYPSHKGQLQMLNSGLLGSGGRVLLNSSLPPGKTLTLVDVNLQTADTTYTTYSLPSLQLVDQQRLPRLIAAPNGLVLRRDVQWQDLTPQEQAMQY